MTSKPTARQIRLLRRFVWGDCPRIGDDAFEALCGLDGMPNALQRESALGADTSGGFILTSLHQSEDDTTKVRDWLIERGYLDPDEKGQEHG